jgi:DNA-binding NarL/FixJ family response regulator
MSVRSKRTRLQTEGSNRKKKIRVFLVDDHPSVLEGLRAYLRTKEHIRVVGEAGDGGAAIRKIDTLQPDIVLMDLSLPQLNGLEVMKKVRDNNPTVKQIVYTMHESDEIARASIQSGAQGYVLKGSSLPKLVHAIERVYAGERFFDPTISERWLSEPSSDVIVLGEPEPYTLLRPNPPITQRVGSHRTQGNRKELRALSEQTKSYIEEHLKPSLRVKEVAAAMIIHPSDLERAFRRLEGKTIKKYIDERCKERIMESFACGNQKGCAIAQEFGFETDQAFYRWFRRVYGMPFRQLTTHRQDIPVKDRNKNR